MVRLWGPVTLFAAVASAFPLGNEHGLDFNVTEVDELWPAGQYQPTRRQANRPELRIMPLGASIVWGMGSSNGNGFRKPLRDQLRYRGWLVNMVGSKSNGNMVDRNVEATSGHVITQAHSASRNSYVYKPNVVVINVGTNDAGNSMQNGAGSRMESLVRDLWDEEGMGETLVVISSVLPASASSNTHNTNRVSINNQYRELISRLRGQGRPIWWADMEDLSHSAGDFDDALHPNDRGFFKMARNFWIAIEHAWQSGLIKQAAPFQNVVTNTCEKEAGKGSYGGVTQKGSGQGNGLYYHNSEEKGIIYSITSEHDRNQWFFARLFGRNRDDLLGWWDIGGSIIFGVHRNTGGGRFTKMDGDLKVGVFCNTRAIHFVDLNADGYDDFVCVQLNGDVLASINNKDGSDSRIPTFNYIGMIKTREGFDQDRVRWADIDGDGRADYCVMDNGGNIWCWRNGGQGDKPEYWQALGMRFTAKGMGDMRGVRFEDINGDGRDDWLWVGDQGQTTTWTNARSCQKGQLGNGLNAAWRQGFWRGQSSGPTHAGVGSFGNDLRNRIHFARIFGEPEDFYHLPRADYVFLQSTKTSDGKYRFDMRAWKNVGSGGTKLEADGNKYCNMMGHSDGRMDYVWTWSDGRMTIYPNLGKKSVGEDSFWGPSAGIFSPGRNLDRRDIHLVDWNNDGACDIVYVDPNNNNRVSVWLNRYKATGTWTWTYQANPAPQLNCPQRRGIGFDDLAVRFGDISGNGLSDYICLEKDGRSYGYVHNTDGSWTFIDQFKFSEGADRANLRWADVNGDGKDDMIWVDKFNGDAQVFINNGRKDTGGSRYEWLKRGKQYSGSVAGTCQHFPDLDGDGRADLHSVMGTWTNRAETWFNRCGAADNVGDDAGWAPGQDPGMGNLPVYVPPAIPSTPGYLNIKCDATAALKSDLEPGPTRWKDADANSAWDAAVQDWNNKKGRGFSFSAVVSDFFSATSNRRCHNVPDAECSKTISCGQGSDPNAAVNSPAGYMIMNSFANIHRVMDTIEDSMIKALVIFTTDADPVVKNFAQFSDNTAVNIALDVFSLLFASASTGVWVRALRSFAVRNPIGAPLIQDGILNLVNFGVGFTRSNLPEAQQLQIGSSFRTLAGTIANAYRSTNRQMAWRLFNGEDTSTLDKLIRDGNSATLVDVDPKWVEDTFYQSLMAVVVPLSWNTWADRRVFIMTGEGMPGSGCTKDPTNSMPKDVADAVFACIDGESYWVVSFATDCPNQTNQNVCFSPSWKRIIAAPGWSTIDGKNWGGLQRDDLVRSTLDAWKKNGRKNGWNIKPDASNSDVLDSLVRNGVKSPGVFNIPVCSSKEAYSRALHKSVGGPWWPCNDS